MNKRTNWIVGISDGKAHEYKIGNVTFTVLSEFEPMKSENTIKSRFEKSITSDFTDLTDGLSTDNTEVLAWAIENPNFAVGAGADSIGSLDAIAPAVQKGNKDLLDWLNNEIKELGKENFFHADYEATLREVYGKDSDAYSLVVEGGNL